MLSRSREQSTVWIVLKTSEAQRAVAALATLDVWLFHEKDSLPNDREAAPAIMIVDRVTLTSDRVRNWRERTSVRPSILLLCDRDDLDRLDELWAEGIDDHLTRPYSEADLRARTLGLLRARAIARRADHAEAFLRAVLASTPDPFFTVDGEGRLTYVNPEGARLLGADPEKVVGKPLDDLVSGLRPALSAPGRGTLPPPCDVSISGEIYSPSVRFVRAESGTGMAVALRKVTERRRFEEELRQSDKRKNEFLAIVAHEIRNPLEPVINSIEVLRTPEATEGARERAIEMIERQTTQMTRLVDDLLDISRISRGKISLQKEPLELVSLVQSTVEDQRGVLEHRGLRVELDVPTEPIWTRGDPTRLQQVIGNLLQNARKFTAAPGRVSVRLTCVSKRAVLSVKDTGAGIPTEMLDKIFEPFTQANAASHGEGAGLGLGLALVKGFVELHGGTVRATSEGLGLGAELIIELPIQRPRELSSPSRSRTPSDIGLPRRVLIIEDNEDAAESLSVVLGLSGHQAFLARDGSEGIELARKSAPDVIICDIGLPGSIDGYDVARVLRQDSQLRSAYLVALSGYGREEDKRRARQAGFDLHITKPLEPSALRSLLASLPAQAAR
jgi:signal transduction histidine kinase